MDKQEAVAQLMRIHYQFFMTKPRFWNDKDLREADGLICVAASNLRVEIKNETRGD